MATQHDAAGKRDNLLGVCAAIAEVTGLPSLAVRLAFVAGLFLALQLTVVGYCVAAVAIHIAQLPVMFRRRIEPIPD